LIDTDNTATPFGVAADTIASLSASGPNAQKLRLPKLDDPALLAALIPGVGFTFGDFHVRLV
jgi:hypothetical protein